MQLTILAIGKDVASLKVFDQDHIGDAELTLLANLKNEPLSTIANRYLLNSREVFCLCHNNAWFGPGSLEIFVNTAMEGKMCGIVGRSMTLEYCWCHSNPAKVSTLDGCSLFFPVKYNLRFDDKTFNGLHCHVEDLCLQGQKLGMEIVVPTANAAHKDAGHTPSENEAWQRDYWRYRAILANKWKGTTFHTT